MFLRITGGALLLATALLMTHVGPVARAAPPNRLYGTVTVNGAAPAIGTSIVAMAKGQTCGSTTVTAPNAQGYTYQMDVPGGGAPQECDAGAVLTFTIGGQLAGQTHTLDDLGTFRRLDLTAPGTPNVPGAVTPLTTGCTDVTSAFGDNTPVSALAAAVSPATALNAVWRWDEAAGEYRGFSPEAGSPSDLKSISRGDKLRICVTTSATLTQPV